MPKRKKADSGTRQERRMATLIPPWEFGPGCYLDIENNTLYGVSGVIYRNVEVNRKDLEKLLKEMRN